MNTVKIKTAESEENGVTFLNFLILSNEDYSNCISPAVFYAIFRLTDFSSYRFDISSSEVG